MTDPLSIASGALGFVSLGLTACKSIISFCETYKSQDEETKSLASRSKELRDMLEIIKVHTPKLQHSHPKIVKNIEASIDAVVDSLNSLDPALAKSRKGRDSRDLMDKLRTFPSRAAYPFRRETVLDLNRRVNESREHLSFALEILRFSSNESSSTEILARLENLQESVMKLRSSGDLATPSPSQLDRNIARSNTIEQPQVEISDGTSARALVIPQQTGYTKRMCLCRSQRSGEKAVWQVGPFALFSHATRSSKHVPDCPYHIRWEDTQRYGVEIVLPTWGRRHFVQAFLNWNVAGGIFPISPGLRIREVVSDDNPAFLAIKSICLWKRKEMDQFRFHEIIDTALLSIRKSFQERQASPVVVNRSGRGLLVALFLAISIHWEEYITSPVAIVSFLDSFRKLIFALREYGVPFNNQGENGSSPGTLLISVILTFAYPTGIDPSNHLFWTEMIRLLRELIVSYDIEFDKSIAGREGVLRYFPSYNSAEENNVLLIELLDINDIPWSNDLGCYGLGRAILRRSLTEIKRLIAVDPRQLDDKTIFGHSVIHLAIGWPEGLELLLNLGAERLINDGDVRGGSPLAYACVQHHFDSARLLISSGCRIDADLLFLAVKRQDRGSSKILDLLLAELVRRRRQLLRFAERHLGKSFVDSLGVPPDAVPDQWAVFKIQEACHVNRTLVPQRMYHSTESVPEEEQPVVRHSVFGFSISSDPSSLESLSSAGFKVRPDLLPWTFGGRFGWTDRFSGVILDQVDWFIRCGYDVDSQFSHDATSFMAYTSVGRVHDPFGFDVKKSDIPSTRKRAETFEKVYFSSYSVDHHCPCSTEGCSAATASLVKATPNCRIDGLLWAVFSMESKIEFCSEAAEMGVLEAIAASSRSEGLLVDFPFCRSWDCDGWAGRPCWYCRGRAQRTIWKKEKWIELAPKLVRAYLFQFLRLTHSVSCCKAGLDEEGVPNKWEPFVCVLDDDTIRKRQEEERPRVAELETLVRKLADEFKSESMRLTMSRFLEEVAKPRAENLLKGWKDSEQGGRPQQSGIIYEIDSDDPADDG